jgi:hypothetical protein
MIVNQESVHQRKETTAVPGVLDLFCPKGKTIIFSKERRD